MSVSSHFELQQTSGQECNIRPFQGGASFLDHLFYLRFVFIMHSCLFNAALWSPAGEGLTSWLSCVWCIVVYRHLPVWCPRSGVVLDS